MASEIFAFAVTVPAGTLQAAPQRSELAMPPREVQVVEVRVPPGPRGQLGFALAMAHVAILPSNPGQFFIMDDDRVSWPLQDQNTSGAWQLLAYNTGLVDHTIYLRFLTQLPAAAGPLTPAPLIPLAQLQP